MQHQHIHDWCLFSAPCSYSSLVCVSLTLSLRAITCTRGLGEKNVETDTHCASGLELHAAELLRSISSLESELLMLAFHSHLLLRPVKEILPFLVNATYIKYTRIHFPGCCTFNDCFHLPRFIPSCPTWQTDEASFNAIIATAAMYFSAHSRAYRLSLFFTQLVVWLSCARDKAKVNALCWSTEEKSQIKCKLFEGELSEVKWRANRGMANSMSFAFKFLLRKRATAIFRRFR